jgi:hypothetical protein
MKTLSRSQRASLVLMVLVLVACEHRDPPDGFSSEERDVMNAVAFPGSSIAAPLRVSRRGFGATATWDLAIPTTWAQYHKALALTSLGYRESGADENGATLSRSTSGDTFSLRIDKVSAEAPLHLRYTLTAIPY